MTPPAPAPVHVTTVTAWDVPSESDVDIEVLLVAPRYRGSAQGRHGRRARTKTYRLSVHGRVIENIEVERLPDGAFAVSVGGCVSAASQLDRTCFVVLDNAEELGRFAVALLGMSMLHDALLSSNVAAQWSAFRRLLRCLAGLAVRAEAVDVDAPDAHGPPRVASLAVVIRRHGPPPAVSHRVHPAWEAA